MGIRVTMEEAANVQRHNLQEDNQASEITEVEWPERRTYPRCPIDHMWERDVHFQHCVGRPCHVVALVIVSLCNTVIVIAIQTMSR